MLDSLRETGKQAILHAAEVLIEEAIMQPLAGIPAKISSRSLSY